MSRTKPRYIFNRKESVGGGHFLLVARKKQPQIRRKKGLLPGGLVWRKSFIAGKSGDEMGGCSDQGGASTTFPPRPSCTRKQCMTTKVIDRVMKGGGKNPCRQMEKGMQPKIDEYQIKTSDKEMTPGSSLIKDNVGKRTP